MQPLRAFCLLLAGVCFAIPCAVPERLSQHKAGSICWLPRTSCSCAQRRKRCWPEWADSRLRPPTAPGLGAAMHTRGRWKQRPALAPGCPGGSGRTQAEPGQAAAENRRSPRSAHKGDAAAPSRNAHAASWLNSRPQQPKLEQVSLVNINFISFRAKLTKPLQCKNVLSVITQHVARTLCLFAGVSYV